MTAEKALSKMGHRCAPRGLSREGRGKGTDLRVSEDMVKELVFRPSVCSEGCGRGRAHAMGWIVATERGHAGLIEVGIKRKARVGGILKE